MMGWKLQIDHACLILYPYLLDIHDPLNISFNVHNTSNWNAAIK
jgi:hypothetical protein